jgi:hypothetical protein
MVFEEVEKVRRFANLSTSGSVSEPTLDTGLLGRPWRPSVARTAPSLEWLSGGLRRRCSGERRPPSKTDEPGRGALPVECPVAECAKRAIPARKCAGTFRTPHVPREAPFSVVHERGADSQWREKRPMATIHRRLEKSASIGRAVSDDFGGNARPGVNGDHSEHRLRGHSREARSEQVAFRSVGRLVQESIALGATRAVTSSDLSRIEECRECLTWHRCDAVVLATAASGEVVTSSCPAPMGTDANPTP